MTRTLNRNNEHYVRELAKENSLELFTVPSVQLGGVVAPKVVVLVRRSPRELTRLELRGVLVVGPAYFQLSFCSPHFEARTHVSPSKLFLSSSTIKSMSSLISSSDHFLVANDWTKGSSLATSIEGRFAAGALTTRFLNDAITTRTTFSLTALRARSIRRGMTLYFLQTRDVSRGRDGGWTVERTR